MPMRVWNVTQYQVTKVLRAEKLEADIRKRLYDAIGFDFINRLLITDDVPEECDEYTYKALALTLLACYATEQDLLSNVSMLGNVPFFNKVIGGAFSTAGKDESEIMIHEAYQCLMGLASIREGRDQLIEKGTVGTICRAFSENLYGEEMALQLVLSLVCVCGPATWQNDSKSQDILLNKLSGDLLSDKTHKKFELLEVTVVLLLGTFDRSHAEPDFSKPWMKNLHSTVSELLQSKLGQEQRESVLKLASLLTEHTGLAWILGPAGNAIRHLLLLVNLAGIEVRMNLEDRSLSQVESSASLLCSCYSILESAIQYMVEGVSLPLSMQQIGQLHSTMHSALAAVIGYLELVARETGMGSCLGGARMELEITELREEAEIERCKNALVVQASVRLLGAWMAEETVALRADVVNLLPFLLHLGAGNISKIVAKETESERNTSQDENIQLTQQDMQVESGMQACADSETIDLLRFLVPGLCHLVAEEGPRKLLLEQGAPLLLMRFMRHHWKRWIADPADTNSQTTLISICGFFQNIVVTEPELVAGDELFTELLQFALSTFHTVDVKDVVLVGNILVLGLLLVKNKSIDSSPNQVTAEASSKFFLAAVSFLRSVHTFKNGRLAVKPAFQKHWEDCEELWFLAMQVLGACISQLPWLPQRLRLTGWPAWIQTMVKNVKGTGITDEEMAAFASILETLEEPKRQVL
ncbi:PREDICTED: neurochondrin-like isoform X2 [Priapulus caudatus]|uniref:Neurochondrin-like isoform X2 n=1 Tax=Priapulus caudatus TaxID=37621 RepID=A0ABM1DSF5_PRICU|nr:PREDICTED: neurochondrin-like isoform X2 [Priapulus caudatus]